MISVKNLSKQFGSNWVLKDINAEIHKGEVISIIGPSGTGKSTFLRCLNLLERPSGGSILIDGVNILQKGADEPKLRRKMGMVFQSFNLFAHLTVLGNLTIGPMKLLGKSRQQAEAKAIELLKSVGLSEKIDQFPDELSGGQKQRVAIARCLAMDPEIILFDEPTSALDPTMVSEVLGQLLLPLAGGEPEIDLTLEYSEKTAEFQLLFDYAGAAQNPFLALPDDDNLSLRLIEKLAKSSSYSCSEGNNQLRISI